MQAERFSSRAHAIYMQWVLGAAKELPNSRKEKLAQRLLIQFRAPDYRRMAVTDPAVLPDQPDTNVHVVGFQTSQCVDVFF